MSETALSGPAGGDASAGALLKRAREKQGLHIAALAATIKVSPRKLELLEADRHDELPDATFTRALAQTVCRTLKIDPAPVLALLPPGSGYRLEQVSGGINTPFRDDGRQAAADEWSGLLLRPAVVVPALVVLAAAVLWLLPPGTLTRAPAAPTAAPAAPASAPAVALPAASAPAVAAADLVVAPPAPAAPVVAPEPVAVAPATTLQVRATAPSWVEVIDGGGQALISRIVAAGEVVDLDGALPLRLRVGNVGATQVAFRGQPVELAPWTRDNVARLELK